MKYVQAWIEALCLKNQPPSFRFSLLWSPPAIIVEYEPQYARMVIWFRPACFYSPFNEF